MESEIPRYIVLGATILDREKIISVYQHKDIPGRVVVELQGADDHHFDSGDAIKLWRMMDPEPGWKEE